MYNISIPKKVEKRIKRIPKEYLARIREAIANLAFNPFAGKKLDGNYSKYFSVRVWPYRIIYSIKKERLVVEVIEIEHRGSAYKK